MKDTNESTRVLVALAAAIAGGLYIGATVSARGFQFAALIAPVGTMWVNAIRMTVVPLVVSLLITGVASATDTKSIGRVGGRTMAVFLLLLASMAAVMIPLASMVFSMLPSGGAARPSLPFGADSAARDVLVSGQAPTLAAWLTSLIPTNPIAAAASGAMLPLVLFTLLFALAVSRSSTPSRAAILGFFQALAEAMLILVRWVIFLAPIGVFALVLPLTARVGATVAGAIGFYIIAYSVLCIVAILFLDALVVVFGRIGFVRFERGILPAQLIAFSSSSSLASLPAMVDCAESALGIPKRVTGFVLPLAASTFKVAGPVSWSVGALFVAWFYGVPLHARELATIGLAAVFLAFGVPGVPRGAFIMLAPLFVAIGLPVEGIGILIAVDVIPDTFATVLNVTGNLAATAIVAAGEASPVTVHVPESAAA
jgi:Na+/H+-dicarboxylate symporter